MTPDRNSKPNWPLLAGLRFLLALIVFMYHGAATFSQELFVWHRSFGPTAAVMVFLIISGYSIAASYSRESAGFYRRRFWRIVPMYWMGSAVALLPFVLWGREISLDWGSTAMLPSTTAIIKQFLLLTPALGWDLYFNAALWTVSIEMALYLVTPLFARLSVQVLVLLAVISLACFMVLPGEANAWAYPRLAWGFIIGWLIFHHSSNLKLHGLLATLTMAAMVRLSISGEWLAPIVALLGLLAVTQGHKVELTSRLRSAFEYLGDLSYPLYAVHTPLISLWVLTNVNIGYTHPAMMLLPILFISAIFLHLVDRPFRALGRGTVPRWRLPWRTTVDAAEANTS